jgi:hypothetical protein
LSNLRIISIVPSFGEKSQRDLEHLLGLI